MVATFGVSLAVMIGLFILVLVGIVAALRIVVSAWLRRKVDLSFEQELQRHRATFDADLERHKSELAADLATHTGEIQQRLEKVRHALQRQQDQLRLYTGKQHDIYPRSYSLLRKAEGALVRPLIERGTYWAKADRDDFLGAARYWKIKESLLSDVLHLLDQPDRRKAAEEMERLIADAKLKHGLEAFRRAKNYAVVNILYFSAPVRDAVGRAIDKMAEYAVYEEEPDEGKGREQYERGGRIGAALNELRDLMSAELRNEIDLVATEDAD